MPQFPAYHRYLRRDNRDEPALVRQSGFLKGGDARVLAGGRRINAYPGPGAGGRDQYDFSTGVEAKLSYGFRNGKMVPREVYWPEGAAGVVDFPDEGKIGIPARVIKEAAK